MSDVVRPSCMRAAVPLSSSCSSAYRLSSARLLNPDIEHAASQGETGAALATPPATSRAVYNPAKSSTSARKIRFTRSEYAVRHVVSAEVGSQ